MICLIDFLVKLLKVIYLKIFVKFLYCLAKNFCMCKLVHIRVSSYARRNDPRHGIYVMVLVTDCLLWQAYFVNGSSTSSSVGASLINCASYLICLLFYRPCLVLLSPSNCPLLPSQVPSCALRPL